MSLTFRVQPHAIEVPPGLGKPLDLLRRELLDRMAAGFPSLHGSVPLFVSVVHARSKDRSRQGHVCKLLKLLGRSRVVRASRQKPKSFLAHTRVTGIHTRLPLILPPILTGLYETMLDNARQERVGFQAVKTILDSARQPGHRLSLRHSISITY